MTKLKLAENSAEELVALLQRRGKINTENENGFKWQSFAGLCEITSYGKAEDGEIPDEALKREMMEEIGQTATEMVFNAQPTKIFEEVNADEAVYIWTALCDKNILKQIKLDISTGGIEILREDDLKRANFSTFKDKGLTVKSLDEINIFEAPREVLKKSFSLFQ